MVAKEWYREGVKKIAGNDLQGAIEGFQKALDEDAEFYLAHLGICQALDRSGKVDEAIVHARKAIELAPDEPLSHTSLSRLYQQKDMIPEAEEELAIANRLQKAG
ncbi:MAG: tetratricopeptide repeat protein [bacterium]|nr:tetratricopeptide repeat protein [bacterium]